MSISSHSSKHSNRDYVPTPNLNISFIRGETIDNCTDDSSEMQGERAHDLSMDSRIHEKSKSKSKFKGDNIV